MSIAFCKSVGKAKINIEAKGCVECGTQFSSGWSVDRTVLIVIGKTRIEVPLSICNDCKKKKGR